MLYLSRRDVEKVGLSMPEIIAALEEMFREKAAGRTEMPPKPGIHPRPDSFIHAMPAQIPSLRAAGMKWVSGFPGNVDRGLPYISGLLILNDTDSGLPLAVMDCTWITAMRTGAATAIAAKYLARPESETVGILACGVQGRSNLEALACCFDLKTVKAFDIRPDVARRFCEEMSEKLDLDVLPVCRPEEAVVGLDIVVTSGPILKKPTPVIESGWLKAGGFASAVDFDSYWTPASMLEVEKLATDDIEQMEYYRREGYFQRTPKAYAELAELIAGRKEGRKTPFERTMAINLGIALEDMATASKIYAKALEADLGADLEL
ncbi:MAG: ornithine cyclodeaminase family protein [Elusimicrobia bacterium]|nr:ornithine cyclodeaminase family protein [Elusimicrobiota bacterium]